MPTDLLEVDGINAAGDLPGLVEPTLEAEVAHAAAFEARGAELGRAMQDAAAIIADGPAGRAAEIEGEDRKNGRACLCCRHSQSRGYHDGLLE